MEMEWIPENQKFREIDALVRGLNLCVHGKNMKEDLKEKRLSSLLYLNPESKLGLFRDPIPRSYDANDGKMSIKHIAIDLNNTLCTPN